MNRTFRGAVLGPLPLLLFAGCVTLDAGPSDATGQSAAAAPSQVVAFWQPDVQFTPDPANGGVEKPTLFGRVYLFTTDLKYPIIGDGKLVVDLYQGPIPRTAPPSRWRNGASTRPRSRGWRSATSSAGATPCRCRGGRTGPI